MHNFARCLNVTGTAAVDLRVVVRVDGCRVVEISIVNNCDVFVPLYIDPGGESKLLNPGLAFEAQVTGFVNQVRSIAGRLQVLIAFIFHC